MNALRSTGLVAALFLSSLVCRAADTEPNYLDFESISPAAHGEYVDVDLDQGLLKLVALFADKQEKEAADLLRGLKHVRVHVLTLDDSNRAPALDRVQQVRKSLESDGWKRIVTVKQDKSDDVAIFARVRGEAIEGLAITVVDGDRQAVFVNVTGEIRPEQISALGTRFNIDPLKKLQVAKN